MVARVVDFAPACNDGDMVRQREGEPAIRGYKLRRDREFVLKSGGPQIGPFHAAVDNLPHTHLNTPTCIHPPAYTRLHTPASTWPTPRVIARLFIC